MSKPCLLVPFHPTILSKHFLKQDLNWKKALDKEKGFLLHETSASHSEAIEQYVKSKTSNHAIGKTPPSSTKPDKQTENRNALMKIFAKVHTLGYRLYNPFSTNVPFTDKPGIWNLLAKYLKNTCGRVTPVIDLHLYLQCHSPTGVFQTFC